MDQALDNFTSDLSKKITPTGGAINIHKAIGKLLRPKVGNTGELTIWNIQPYNKVDEIAAYHDITQ